MLVGTFVIRIPYCAGDCIQKQDDEHIPGDGVYVRFHHIHSAIAGIVKIEEMDNGKKKISVVLPTKNSTFARIPTISSIVTCKVTNVGSTSCRVSIHCLEKETLKHPFKGIIRKEDIREIEKGTVEIHKCFRVGDIILARVIGVGENHSFLLSTAEDELGVSVAYSRFNKKTPMVPVNWTQMRCPKTFVKELRKVAKISFEE
jgi:exosome complex RNA-binding protein Csl4